MVHLIGRRPKRVLILLGIGGCLAGFGFVESGAFAATPIDSRYVENSSAYADTPSNWYTKNDVCAQKDMADACAHTPWLNKPAPGAKTITKSAAVVIARDKYGVASDKSASAKLVAYSGTQDHVGTVDPARPVWVVQVDAPPPFVRSYLPTDPGDPTTTLPPVPAKYTVILDGLSGLPISTIGGQ